ncbi:zinc finger BED domain-containing protein RICESLEEPER 2-like protein [Tanacetum coccineum]
MDDCSSTSKRLEFQYRPLQHLTRSKPFSCYIQRCDNIFYTRGVMSFGDMKEEVTVKRKDEIAYLEQGIYKPLPLIAPDAKYDANKLEEAIASCLMVTEHPFSTMEDEMFAHIMKTANPLFERISRLTAKAYCFKVYQHYKEKLKALTNALSNINLTTDCWSFVHVPPPRTALDVAHGIYNYLKEWEIEGKIFSVSVDNVAYNDKVVRTLKANFSRVKNFLVRAALKFKDVLPRYAEHEPHFSHLPSDEARENVTAVCEDLNVFKVCANIISGYNYTTTNLYLKKVYKVEQTIDKSALSRNDFIREMTKAMKEKFANCKHAKEVSDAHDNMFKDYVEMHDEIVREAASHGNGSCGGSTNLRSNKDEEFGNFYKGTDVEKCDKSELKKYLEEGLLEGH